MIQKMRKRVKQIISIGIAILLACTSIDVQALAAENVTEVAIEASTAEAESKEESTTEADTTGEADEESTSEMETETETKEEPITESETETEEETVTESEPETETEEAPTTEQETETQPEEEQKKIAEGEAVGEPPVYEGDADLSMGSAAITGTSVSITTAYHTAEEIENYLASLGATLSDPVTYKTNPVTSGDYNPGELSDETLNSAINMLNQVRYIAGLDSVTLDSTYNELCQAGTLVNYVNNVMTHYPSRPSEMSEELYKLGYEGCSSSNIAWCSLPYMTLNYSTLRLWMGDSDQSNIDRIGHRRWLLNPTMHKTGFGAVSGDHGIYSAVYAFDGVFEDTNITGVTWPARVMPTSYFATQDAWSVSLGIDVDYATVQVMLTRRSDGKVWNFSSESANGYFNVDNGGYGQPGCIIFRPSGISSYNDGDIFDVKITYNDNQKLDYTVSFFTIGKYYSITYKLDGGTNSEANPFKYRSISDTIRLQPAEKFGYEFQGWYKDSAFKTQITEITPGMKANITLYAKWIKIPTAIDKGNCGSSLTWELNSDGLLKIMGTGSMTDYAQATEVPWYAYREHIQSLEIGENVTSIGQNAFAGCTVLGEVFIPEGITLIGSDAFAGAENVYLYCYTDYVANYAIQNSIPHGKFSQYTVADPVFSIRGNTEVTAGTRLYITTQTNGAQIYYTLDGTDPTAERGILYEDAIVITQNTTIKAIAIRESYQNSNTVSASYTIIDESDNWGDITEEDKAELGIDKATEIPDGLWVAGVTDRDYTGKQITFADMRVYHNKTLLQNKKDYTIAYRNNTKAGTAVIAITGRGNYTGTAEKRFTIRPLDIAKATASDILLAYTGKVQKKTTPVRYEQNGKQITLKNGTDYTILYPKTDKNAANYDANAFKEPGEYSIEIKGKGNYTGSLTIKEIITSNNLISKATVTKIPAQKYTGSPIILGDKLKLTKGKTVLLGISETDYNALSADQKKAYSYTYSYINNRNIGTASIHITGVNDYTGERTVTFNITGNALSKASFNKALTKSYTWTGTAIEPVAAMTADIQTASLTYKTGKEVIPLKGISKAGYETLGAEQVAIYDYTYEYIGDTTNIGTVKICLTGVNAYSGTVTKSYKITGLPVSKTTLTGYAGPWTYTGSGIKPAGEEDSMEIPSGFRVYQKATKTQPEYTLVKGRDYTISYQKNTQAGTATIIITGINGYTGTLKKSFKISAYSIKDDSQKRITVDEIGSVPYTKGGATPLITVRDAKTAEPLVLGKDYTVTYKNHTKVNDGSIEKSAPTVTIKGKGNYTGAITRTYAITGSSLDRVAVSATDITYSKKGNICKPIITLTDVNNKKLAAGTDYEKTVFYTYAKDVTVQIAKKDNNKTIYTNKVRLQGEIVQNTDIIPVGAEIKAQITGKGYYAASTKEVVFRYVAADIAKATASVTAQVYTGRAIEPSKDDITVKLGKTILSKNDYEIVGFQNNIAKGTATVTIRGIGNYGGTKNIPFRITGFKLFFWQ